MVAMERGEALNEWAGRAQPDLPSCMPIIMHLVGRVAELHQNGFVHCDLKPSNGAAGSGCCCMRSGAQRMPALSHGHA